MRPKHTYLQGRFVFIVSLVVIGVTFLTVYLTGVNYYRSISSNLYISLSIIGVVLFLFMAYGLYKGINLKDDYPKFRNFKTGEFIPSSGELPDIEMPSIVSDEGVSGFIISILLWVAMAILFFFLLLVLEAFFWISIFIILAMLYWVFFRALRLVFSKSLKTKDNLGIAVVYALGYTFLYLGWIFAIVYFVELWL